MKYNRYLIAGIILFTLILMFLFAGMMSGSMESHTNSISERNDIFSTGTTIIGIIIPIILAIIYTHFRHTKGE